MLYMDLGEKMAKFKVCLNILKLGNLVLLFNGVKIAKSVILLASTMRFSKVSFLNFASDVNNAVALKEKSDYKIILKTTDNKTSISAVNLNEVDGSTEALLSKINELLS